MNLKTFKLWLPCFQIAVAIALLAIGQVESLSHHVQISRIGILYQFDYVPVAFQWLAALNAPSALLTFPVTAIPRMPKPITVTWFLCCVGAFWYWVGSELDRLREPRQLPSSRRCSRKVFNWLSLALGVVLFLLSAWAALRGASMFLADIGGCAWGASLVVLFARRVTKLRSGLAATTIRRTG
jgi:hypothetical protein